MPLLLQRLLASIAVIDRSPLMEGQHANGVNHLNPNTPARLERIRLSHGPRYCFLFEGMVHVSPPPTSSTQAAPRNSAENLLPYRGVPAPRFPFHCSPKLPTGSTDDLSKLFGTTNCG